MMIPGDPPTLDERIEISDAWIAYYESRGKITESERTRLSNELDEIESLILLGQVQNGKTQRTTT